MYLSLSIPFTFPTPPNFFLNFKTLLSFPVSCGSTILGSKYFVWLLLLIEVVCWPLVGVGCGGRWVALSMVLCAYSICGSTFPWCQHKLLDEYLGKPNGVNISCMISSCCNLTVSTKAATKTTTKKS